MVNDNAMIMMTGAALASWKKAANNGAAPAMALDMIMPMTSWVENTLRMSCSDISLLCIKADPKPPSANRPPSPCTNRAMATKPKGSGPNNLASRIPIANCKDNETIRPM